MLASLTIKNVVLIDQLTIDFHEGLCALTGETGAGKSILLDSLGLVLGSRADFKMVRHNADQASVSACFDLPDNHPVNGFLKDQDVSLEDSLILRRSLTKEGRSRAYINDQPVSVSLLKKVGDFLVEVHGQFDTQSLLDPQTHIHILDEYAGNKTDLSDLNAYWTKWKQKKEELEFVREKITKARDDEDYLRSSLEDLDALSPQQGEEEKLSQIRERLMRREQILEGIQNAETGLGEIENTSGVVWRSLEKIGSDGKQAMLAMERMNTEMQEVMSSLQNLLSDLQSAEYSLQEIDDRLFSLKAQARKHNCTIDQLSAKREEIAMALNSIENQDGVLADLIKEVEKNKNNYEEQAKKISQKRKKYGEELATFVMCELTPLKLDKANFDLSIETLPEENWGRSGIDKVQFLVATNPGSALGRLNKIASGGEMARFMLALKVVLAEVGTVGTLVFDEVDSGVGGATATAVGERLSKLAKNRQVLVVTHSPQVAATADYHWIVSKSGADTVTTKIFPVFDKPQRKEEIARMISGSEITEEARAAAGKLLESSAA